MAGHALGTWETQAQALTPQLRENKMQKKNDDKTMKSGRHISHLIPVNLPD